MTDKNKPDCEPDLLPRSVTMHQATDTTLESTNVNNIEPIREQLEDSAVVTRPATGTDKESDFTDIDQSVVTTHAILGLCTTSRHRKVA